MSENTEAIRVADGRIEVSPDFVAGFMQAYQIAQHMEAQQYMPFKSLLGACASSPSEAMERWSRNFVVKLPAENGA